MYIYGPDARIEGDEQHNKVVDSLTEMERMRNPVIVAAVIYVVLMLGGTVWWVMHYAIPFLSNIF